MQPAERTCHACGSIITGGAATCTACELFVCASCMESTARCPKCEGQLLRPRGVADATPMARGRRQAIAIAVTLLGSVVVVGLLGGTPVMGVVFQVAVLGLLVAQLFRGRAWARWVLVALVGLGAAANGYQAVAHFGEGPWGLSLALALAFGWCAIVLALSPPLARYLRAQRARTP